MRPQTRQDREFKKAEEVYVANLLRLMGQIFQITPQRDTRKINIPKDLKREVVKKRIELITAPLFYLGIAHADELIEQYRPKTVSAGRAPFYLAAAKPPTSYNEILITQLTKHTVDSMAYVANNTRQDLINSLNEGYANGEGMPALTKRVQAEWLTNKVSAKRFARTFTNEVYNQAHFNRYQESSTIDAIQFSAHIDSRTSNECRMLHKTIWALDDPAILTPPLHFNCRSRTVPYFGQVPGPRNFRHAVDGTEFTTKDILKIQGQINHFKTKYWNIPISEIPRFPGVSPATFKKYTQATSQAEKDRLYALYTKELAENPEYMREVIKWQKMVDAGETSKNFYYINNKYTAERLKLHDDIIAQFFKQTDGPQTAAIFGGPSGSGKSQLLKHVLGDKDNYIYINNDEIKKLLPGYNGANANFFHSEARDITDKLIAKALSAKSNIIYDTTLRDYDKAMRIYNDMITHGYSTQVLSTNLPLEQTLSRAVSRAISMDKEGRYVPLELIIKNTEATNAIQFRLIDSVDHITIFDSNVKYGDDLVQIYHKAPKTTYTPRTTLAKVTVDKLDEINFKPIDEFTGWTDINAQNLPDDQLSAIKSYISQDYHDINGHLRTVAKGDKIDDALMAAKIQNIDDALRASSLEQDAVLYRAVSDDAADTLIREGSRTAPGYSSTSLDPSAVEYFAETMGTKNTNVMIITRKKGDIGMYINDAEQEILLPKGLTFKTIKVETADSGMLGYADVENIRLIYVEIV